jgi:UDP-N-acetyl-D-glucosamine dehydrogenase
VVDGINAGRSHIADTSGRAGPRPRPRGLVSATVDLKRLAECDAISICVPTPLNKTKDPDLSYVVSPSGTRSHALRPGQLVILESTTYPGTTREVLLPILEESGLTAGRTSSSASPPSAWTPATRCGTPATRRRCSAASPRSALEAGMAFYDAVFDTMVAVESAEAAELVKVYENTFRLINIALANELAQACDAWRGRVGGDRRRRHQALRLHEVHPGPRPRRPLHPLDPHYLSWKMRTLASAPA